MIFQFPQTIGSTFIFNPVLNGVTYQAVITWNIFRQNWYFNLYDLSGNLVICRAVVSSDDQHAIETISWSYGVVTVVSSAPHFLKLGTVANLMLSGNTPSGYNGIYLCSITSPTTFTYELTDDPGQQVVTGSFGGFTDLTQGAFTGSVLTYYVNNNQFISFP